MTWVAASVEGAEADGARLETVIAGADGLFATGRQTDTTELSGQGPASGWASTDGRSWQRVPPATAYPVTAVGDGEHMVMFGRESCKTTELSAWTSLDGVMWTQLTFSGATEYLSLVSGPICNDDGTEGSMVGMPVVTYAAVMPDGVFVVTSSRPQPRPPTGS